MRSNMLAYAGGALDFPGAPASEGALRWEERRCGACHAGITQGLRLRVLVTDEETTPKNQKSDKNPQALKPQTRQRRIPNPKADDTKSRLVQTSVPKHPTNFSV